MNNDPANLVNQPITSEVLSYIVKLGAYPIINYNFSKLAKTNRTFQLE